jgi:rSAM/selenodomain-associated transferase 1
MSSAFGSALSEGAQRAVMIGADCPEVTIEDVQAAWAALETHDLVLGPANDGGYWLIGLKQVYPELFSSISWSTSAVLAETLARAKQLALRVHLLRTLSDVDTLEDWQAYQQRINALE